MKLEYKTTGSVNQVLIKDDEDKTKAYLTLSGDSSNCKLSYLHQCGMLIRFSDTERKRILDFALSKLKGSVIINTTQKGVADFISKTYPTYYYNKVPTGYNRGFQYHICIKNTIITNYSCRMPTKETKEVAKQGLSKTKVENTLRKVLKEKEIPTRFVNSFIRELVK